MVEDRWMKKTENIDKTLSNLMEHEFQIYLNNDNKYVLYYRK